MTEDIVEIDELRAEIAALRQTLSLVGASYPSRYILGKTGDRVDAAVKAVTLGEPLIESARSRLGLRRLDTPV